MKNRKPGFYWVRRFGFNQGEVGKGEVAKWSGKFWLMVGSESQFDDEEYVEINENRLEWVDP